MGRFTRFSLAILCVAGCSNRKEAPAQPPAAIQEGNRAQTSPDEKRRQLEEVLRSEPTDREWAPAVSRRLAEQFTRNARNDDVALERIICKRTICRIDISFPSVEAGNKLQQKLMLRQVFTEEGMLTSPGRSRTATTAGREPGRGTCCMDPIFRLSRRRVRLEG